jgi:hypothetical protein
MMSVADGQRRGGFAPVRAQVERGDSVYTEKTKAMQIRSPTENTYACKEENAEWEGKCYDEG